jgi:sugar phosphate isomerase/epimerase
LDVVPAAAALSLTDVELNDFMLPPPAYSRLRRPVWQALGAPPAQWRYASATLARLAALLRQYGVRCAGWTVDSDLTVPAGSHRSSPWSLQSHYLRAGLRAARRLQAPIVRLTLGGTTALDPRFDVHVARRLVLTVRAAARLAPGLRLAVENHGDLSRDTERLLAILSTAQAQLAPALQENLGLCLDFGNPQDPSDWSRLAPAAIHVHFKTRAFDDAGAEPTIPYAELWPLLREAGFAGTVVIEYEGDGAPALGIRQSLALYRTVAGAAG